MGSGDEEKWMDLGCVNWIKSIYLVNRMSFYVEFVLYEKVRDIVVFKIYFYFRIVYGLWVREIGK